MLVASQLVPQNLQPDTMVPIKQGGIMYHPAGFVHDDGSRDGEEDEKDNPVVRTPALR